MAISKTDVCNLALGRVGAPTIMDIDDAEAKSARVCKNAYEATVRKVAESGEWKCLKKRDTLGRLVAAPAFEWAYQFQLPVDCLNVVQLNGVDVSGETGELFEIEGRLLLTDEAEAKVQYIALVEDPTQWDSLFTDAVVVLLAAKIAVQIRQDEGMASALMSEYITQALPKARMRNGNKNKRRRFDPCAESRFLSARYVSTNG